MASDAQRRPRPRDSLHALKAVTLRGRTRHAQGGLGVIVVLEALEQRPRQIKKKMAADPTRRGAQDIHTYPIAP